MRELRGIAVSPGIAIGRIHLHVADLPSVPRYDIAEHEVDAERTRLSTAVDRARREIERIRSDAPETGRDVLDTHLMMLDDPVLSESIHTRLASDLLNVEWIVFQTIREMISRLASAQDEYLRERTSDFHDVSRRVLGHLLDSDRQDLALLDREVVIVSHDLLPSEAVAMNRRMVRAIVTEAGGKTSHTAILARSFEIPAVLGVAGLVAAAGSGETVVVDGNRGVVVIDPDPATLSRYQGDLEEWQRHEVAMMRLNAVAAETRDGKLIRLLGNIEVAEEVDAVLSHGADGIGLYRSEFLFLARRELPDEEEQFAAYRSVVESMNGRPVTIRTLDVGGDKLTSAINRGAEKNPILGWRAIRVCLSEEAIFRTQLRALVRASAYGNLRIMFPMISGVAELDRAIAELEAVHRALRTEGVTVAERIPVGAMIEIPSAAMTSDLIARRVDFVSIGTNDLIQYTIAVDRGNERVAYLYEPFHPGVLRLIRMVIENAHEVGRPVAMCGEMAGDPLATPVLLGLGLDEFSMGAVGIPEVKQLIRSMSLAEARELAGTVMDMRDAREISAHVTRYVRERFGVEAYQG